MPEEESVLPEEVRRQKEREEQIKDGVWRPKILAPYSGKVVCGASTRRFAGLIYLRDEERFSHPINKAEKVRAARSLIEFLRALDTELDPKKVVYPELAHTTNVVLVDEKLVRKHIEPRLKIEQTDGLITQLLGYTLMILGADCPSIAVYDPKHQAMGLFHSGWRGTAGGIAIEGIKKMQEAFGSSPSDLIAVVGPGYSANYEVRGDVLEAFRKGGMFSEAELGQIFRPKDEEHFSLDLHRAIGLELQKAGIPSSQIEITSLRTDLDNDLFPSHRKEKGQADRFAFAIALK